jgi:hypothetical protein
MTAPSMTANRYSHLNAQTLLGGVALLASNPPSAGIDPSNPEMSGLWNQSETGGNRAELGTVTIQ